MPRAKGSPIDRIVTSFLDDLTDIEQTTVLGVLTSLHRRTHASVLPAGSPVIRKPRRRKTAVEVAPAGGTV